jgi:2-polyprenyl-3-methyl-5-hydroxy-6-metoxy-1,4-benzoquinol methylase
MPIGPFVRRLFGPYERQVTDAYRRMFVDLDDWTARIGSWMPHAERILEVGCGEGAMTERLAKRYPHAEITAIDITPRLGRLYSGDRRRVTFQQATIEEIATERPGAFDLIVLSDVIHHVPPSLRTSLLQGIRGALTPGGTFIFKEWIRTGTPIHWLCEASDRFLTGDTVSYLDAAEVRALLDGVFGSTAVRETRLVRPWKNNVAMLLKPAN